MNLSEVVVVKNANFEGYIK